MRAMRRGGEGRDLEESLRDVSTDEVLKHHVSFFEKFRSSSSSPLDKPTQDLILVMKQLLFQFLDSPMRSKTRKDPLTC